MGHRLAADLDHALACAAGSWDTLRGQSVFLTGGTGFFGSWLVETFAWANDRLNLGASATVLTRDPGRFQAALPHLASHPAIRLHQGDIRSCEFPAGGFSHIIHAAGSPHGAVHDQDPQGLTDTLVDGTRRVLAFAKRSGVRRVLLVSSGAVYGAQPAGIERMVDDAPRTAGATGYRAEYIEGKRAAEQLGLEAAREGAMDVMIARCYSFLGPYQPLDGQWASGNFVRDALAGGPIRVTGDGTPVRSYLYAAELAAWLWAMVCRGRSGRAYNVGSERGVSVRELAGVVASAGQPELEVQVARAPVPGGAAPRYVPSTHRARTELGLEQHVTLEQAVQRTLAWHRALRPLAPVG